MANVFKDILAQVKSRVAGSSATIRLLVAALLACIAVVLLYWILEKVLYLYLARSYVEELAQVLDLNKNLANAIVWIVFAITVFFASFLFSFSKRKRMIGMAGILSMLVFHSLVLWYGTSSSRQISDKCYVITRHGVHYREHPGIDPETGRQCRPVTAENMERLRRYEKGDRPKLMTTGSPTFFDLGTGNVTTSNRNVTTTGYNATARNLAKSMFRVH